MLLTAVVGGLVFITRVLGADAFGKEEAQHGLYGLWIMRDLRGLDWSGFWYDTSRQMLWPFLHSWVLGTFFLFFGASYISARFLSLLFFVVSIVIMYYLANRLSGEKGPRIGIAATGLALTSPIMIQLATQNMLESLGALLFLSAAALYTICEERKDLLHYIFMAVLFGLAVYTNYFYAFLIVASFIVVTLSKLGVLTAEVADLTSKGEKQALHFFWWISRKLVVMSVLLILLAGWFSFNFSRKILVVMQTLFKYSGGMEITSWWQGLLYYPQVIVSHLSFSPWIGLLLFISLFLPMVAARYHGLNRLYVYAWTPIVLATLFIPSKMPQMIFISLPFILLIAAAVGFWAWEQLQAKAQKLALTVVIILALPLLISLPAAWGMYFPAHNAQNMAQVLDFFKSSVPPGSNLATSLNLQHLSPEVVQFHFYEWKGKVLADTMIDENQLTDGNMYYLSVELDPNSPCSQTEVIDDSIYAWNDWLKTMELGGKTRLAAFKRFEGLCLTAKVYSKVN